MNGRDKGLFDAQHRRCLGRHLAREDHGIRGEMVFNTAMTGYQEVMTDPSYAGQIVTMTYPLIGNYGFNAQDKESHTPAIHGLVISTPCETPAHYQATQTLQDIAQAYDFPILAQVDTRKLTKIIRQHGDVYGKMTKTPGSIPKKQKCPRKLWRRSPLKKHSSTRQMAHQRPT